MDKYKLDDSKIKDIAHNFGTDRDTVKKVKQIYDPIAESMKHQYLAHVIRTVESEVRKVTHKEFFQIRCIPVSPNADLVNFGSAQYFPGQLYLIFYHPEQDEKQLRILIAHELGHLVIETLAQSHNFKFKASEPLSSIFGILTILDKNDFYENDALKYQHNDWNDMLKDFLLLRNRSLSVYNKS